ncbi:MAG: hypothetical protein NT135_01160 [Candidatus Berkelbacteria bacterium]|nr:hypothetical protein [Candidatus Berkelbacteria bacterium]
MICCVPILVIFSIGLAANYKSRFIKETRGLLVLILLGQWLAGMYYARLVFKENHSMYQFFAIVAMIILSAFAIGGSLVITQEVNYQNGGIALRHNGLIHKVLAAWGKLNKDFNPDKQRTICGMAWLLIAIIILYPLVFTVCVAANAIWTLIFFLWAGVNPIKFWIESWRSDKLHVRNPVCAKGIPMSPSIVIVLAGLYYAALHFAHFIFVSLGLILFLFLVYLALCLEKRNMLCAQEEIPSGPFLTVGWQYGIKPTGRNVTHSIGSIFKTGWILIKTIKGELCPKTFWVDEDGKPITSEVFLD